jgi:hypothetical protein
MKHVKIMGNDCVTADIVARMVRGTIYINVIRGTYTFILIGDPLNINLKKLDKSEQE